METATLIVHRVSGGMRDRFRAYRIEIDGEKRAKIKRGASVTLEVLPGAHTVRVAVDWAGSPELELDLAAGQAIELDVTATGGAFDALEQITEDGYLRLAVRGSADG